MPSQLPSSKKVSRKNAKIPCEFCPREVSRRSYLNNHRKKDHDAPEKFTQRWLDITKSRMEGAIYKCAICPRSYCSTSSLKNHLKKKHESQPINPGQCPPAKCFLCKEKFWTLRALFKHIRTRHEGNVQQAGIFAKMSVIGTVSQELDVNKENNVIPESLASSSSSGSPSSRGSPVNALPTNPDRKKTPFMINDILN
ncbi:hypothetical protein B9Z55_027419 [Caenorhabditis nigoni]|uniref:C2H2-type domain-containing protein n=1 Tax=Caenorhabditis nigoni TaxID=1611254 RepID=A0A2G5SG11_9PELO|nr:hypothetical protein B9Z55_027419 [Caenorhabditis nigoni]